METVSSEFSRSTNAIKSSRGVRLDSLELSGICLVNTDSGSAVCQVLAGLAGPAGSCRQPDTGLGGAVWGPRLPQVP